MGILRRNRVVQYPLVAEFVFNFNDAMAPIPGGINGPKVDQVPNSPVVDFGSGVAPSPMPSNVSWSSGIAQTNVFEIMSLPQGAQIIGGDLQVEVAYLGPLTATLSLGEVGNAVLYLPATSVEAVGRTAITIPAELTGAAEINAAAGLDIRATLALGTGAATAGRIRVRVMYTIDGRGMEVQAT